MTIDRIQTQIAQSIETKQQLLKSHSEEIGKLCELAIETLRGGGKLMFCGNGGSSCDAAHAAGELVGWFEDKNREGIAAMALGHEIPTVTAIGNDAGFVQIFSRQLKALGRAGDLLVGISTSGSSKNVVLAMETAKAMSVRTAAFASSKGGPVVDLAEVAVCAPSTSTARVQECHLLVVHILCAAIEAEFAE